MHAKDFLMGQALHGNRSMFFDFLRVTHSSTMLAGTSRSRLNPENMDAGYCKSKLSPDDVPSEWEDRFRNGLVQCVYLPAPTPKVLS